MKLSNAARYFDRDTAYDAYTGQYVFKAQFSSFDSSSPDGSFQRRRTVSLGPDVCLPQRRVVRVHGQRWIIAEPINDGFFDKVIRRTASAKLVTGLFSLLTPGQAALRATNAPTAYGQTNYMKDVVNTNTDSEYDPQFETVFAYTETIPQGIFIKDQNSMYIVRSVRRELEGVISTACDEISGTYGGAFSVNCEVDATFDGPVDPMTELPSAPTTTTGILLDMYKLYDYKTQADPKNLSGDRTLVVAQTSLTPLAGMQLTIGTDRWSIFNFTPYQDAWNLHLRRA